MSPGSPYPGGNSLALTDSTEFKGILPYSSPLTVYLLHLSAQLPFIVQRGGLGAQGKLPPDELPHQDFTHQLNSYSLLVCLFFVTHQFLINHKSYAETHSTPHLPSLNAAAKLPQVSASPDQILQSASWYACANAAALFCCVLHSASS